MKDICSHYLVEPQKTINEIFTDAITNSKYKNRNWMPIQIPSSAAYVNSNFITN